MIGTMRRRSRSEGRSRCWRGAQDCGASPCAALTCERGLVGQIVICLINFVAHAALPAAAIHLVHDGVECERSPRDCAFAGHELGLLNKRVWRYPEEESPAGCLLPGWAAHTSDADPSPGPDD